MGDLEHLGGKLHVLILLALITIITVLAEEIAKGNATSYRCNYVIFTCVIRLALANSLTGVNISQSNTSHTALKIYVQLTQFPSIILRIINPSVHDGLSRYQINFPSVKSQRRPHCLSEDWPARHRVYQQIEHSTRDTCFIEMNNSSVTYHRVNRLPPMAAVVEHEDLRQLKDMYSDCYHVMMLQIGIPEIYLKKPGKTLDEEQTTRERTTTSRTTDSPPNECAGTSDTVVAN
ncbi:hypothetical protein G5I_13413 [Acromyrmex echinatior]|uniref:Uncharacterized protein n=1 Tax=Acromyrmex echinatior TaxID=103372 RepID=F4X4Z0_ACREC|nr:hypothetical protein G5I_13413 [Acromyrmex echinatior]